VGIRPLLLARRALRRVPAGIDHIQSFRHDAVRRLAVHSGAERDELPHLLGDFLLVARALQADVARRNFLRPLVHIGDAFVVVVEALRDEFDRARALVVGRQLRAVAPLGFFLLRLRRLLRELLFFFFPLGGFLLFLFLFFGEFLCVLFRFRFLAGFFLRFFFRGFLRAFLRLFFFFRFLFWLRLGLLGRGGGGGGRGRFRLRFLRLAGDGGRRRLGFDRRGLNRLRTHGLGLRGPHGKRRVFGSRLGGRGRAPEGERSHRGGREGRQAENRKLAE